MLPVFLARLGFAIKPHFLIIWLTLEAVALRRQRTQGYPPRVRPESIAVIGWLQPVCDQVGRVMRLEPILPWASEASCGSRPSEGVGGIMLTDADSSRRRHRIWRRAIVGTLP